MTPKETAGKRATIADVAALAQVDRALVSKVVNADPTLRIKESTRQRITDAVERLNYRPSRMARNLRLSRSSTIGLVVPEITNPVWASLTAAIESEADPADLTLLTGSQSRTVDRPVQFLRLLETNSLDGLLVASPVDQSFLDAARSRNVVLINQKLPQRRRFIIFDDDLAMELAIDHLLDLGHRQIAHLAGPPALDATRRRALAFRRIMTERDLDPQLVLAGDLSAEAGGERMLRLMSMTPRPTAVVVANVSSAAGALRAALAAGIRVPHDVSIVCIHDLEMCSVLTPALTAVRLPLQAMGVAAVRAILDGNTPTEGMTISEGTVLVPRETTAPPPSR